MDESWFERLYRADHQALWRSLAARGGDPAAAGRALIAGAERVRASRVSDDDPEIFETRAEWWSAAFEALPDASNVGGTTIKRDAPSRSGVDEPAPTGPIVLASNVPFALADVLAQLTEAQARLLLGHHIGRLSNVELGRFADIDRVEVGRRLAVAEARIGAVSGSAPPPERWAHELSAFDVPDLDRAVGLPVPDPLRRFRVLVMVGLAVAVVGAFLLLGGGRDEPVVPVRPLDAVTTTVARPASTSGTAGPAVSTPAPSTVRLDLVDTGDGGRAGGVTLPDGRHLWLRLPAEVSERSLELNVGEVGSDVIRVTGADLFLTVSPGPCSDPDRIAPAVVGSVDAVTVGAVPMCLDDGAVELSVYIDDLSSPAALADVDARLLSLAVDAADGADRDALTATSAPSGNRRWSVPSRPGWSLELVGVGPWVTVLERSARDRSRWSLFAVDLLDGSEIWRLEDTGRHGDAVGPGDDGTATRSARALADDRGIVIVLGPRTLHRIDALDGRTRWKVPIADDPAMALEAIWPNTVTLAGATGTLTVGLTEGFILPP